MNKLSKLLYLFGMMLALSSTAQASWEDATASAVKESSTQAMDRVNKVLFSYVMVKNTSNSKLESIRLVIKNPSIPVLNADGVTEQGDAYLTIPNGLAAGESTKIRVNFELKRAKLSFDTQIEKEFEKEVVEFTEVVTEFTYDSTNKVVIEDFGDGKYIEYTYDDSGNLVQQNIIN